MAKSEWAVRVIQLDPVDPRHWSATDNRHISGLWLEQLQRAGFVSQIKDANNAEVVTIEGKEYFRYIFEILAPKGYDSQTWAQHNADRMCSFGINAAAAPRWKR